MRFGNKGICFCDTAINFPNAEIIRRDFSVPEGWESHLTEKEPSFYFVFFSEDPEYQKQHLPTYLPMENPRNLFFHEDSIAK